MGKSSGRDRVRRVFESQNASVFIEVDMFKPVISTLVAGRANELYGPCVLAGVIKQRYFGHAFGG